MNGGFSENFYESVYICRYLKLNAKMDIKKRPFKVIMLVVFKLNFSYHIATMLLL